MLQYKIKTSEDLNFNNVLNILAFILTWVLNSSVAGPPDREHFWTNGIAELQRRYESILTPADLTYLIAHLILFFEGAFTLCQVLPKYRASVMVQEGVQHWFFVSALAQFLWSIDMGIENVWASLVGMFFMVAMFVSLCRILITQAWLTDGNQTPEEYWLLRFPFSVHFGWAFAVMLQSVNGFFVQLGFGMVFQLVLGFISLIAFAGLGGKMLFANGPNPNYMIPLVFAWFCFGIAFTRQGPKVNFDGVANLIFDIVAAVVGVALTGATAYIFYKKEYLEKKEISNEIRDINEIDDTDYTDYALA